VAGKKYDDSPFTTLALTMMGCCASFSFPLRPACGWSGDACWWQ
jgi:hypothetical protein